MQIIFSVTRQLGLFFATVLLIGSAHATPAANGGMLENYRQAFKNSAYPIKYIFVDANGENRDGSCCSSDAPKKIYIVNILEKESSKFVYSPEINRLIKQSFEITIDDKSLISTPKTDYLVLMMSRPPEYNPKSLNCAVGMGEDRAYLIAITSSDIKVLNRNFFNCAGSYRMIHDGGQLGYEIRDYRKGSDQAQSVLYILQDGQLVRKENGPYKEEVQ